MFRVQCRDKRWSGRKLDGIALISLAPNVGILYFECKVRRQMFTWLGLRSNHSQMLTAARREP